MGVERTTLSLLLLDGIAQSV